MRLLIHGDSDEARITIVSYNDIYRNAFNGNSPIDLYSALGDWMPLFSNLCQYEINSKMSYNICNMNVQKSRRMHAMYVDMIKSTLESDVLKKMKIIIKRLCEEIDVNIDNDNNMTQVYEKKCDGTKVIEDVITVTPKVLTIIASKSTDNDNLFSKVPKEVTIRTQKYNMVGLITNNCVHFRAILNIDLSD